MQLNQNGYIEPERIEPQEVSAETTAQQELQQRIAAGTASLDEVAATQPAPVQQAAPTPQPEQQQQPTEEQPKPGLIGEAVIGLMDFVDDKFNGNKTTNEDSRAKYLGNKAKREEERSANPLTFVADEITNAAGGAGGDVVESALTAADLAGDTIGGVLNAVGLDDRDTTQIPWSESYEWADFDLGLAENQTVAGNIGRSVISTVIGMGALSKAGVAVGAGKSVVSRLATESLRGGLYDFFSDADGGNLSNLVQLGPLANPLSKAIAHQDEDNEWIRRVKNTLEGGTIGLAVDGVQEIYKALRAGRAVVDAGGTPEQAVAKVTEYFEQQNLDLGYTPPRPQRPTKAYDVAPEVLNGDISNVSKLDADELKKLESEYNLFEFDTPTEGSSSFEDVLRNADPEAAMEAFGKNITVKELPNGTKIDWIQQDISSEFGAQGDVSLAQRAEAIQELTDAGGQLDNQNIEDYIANKFGTTNGPLTGQKVTRIDWDIRAGELGTNGTKLYKQFGEVAKEQKPGTIIQAEAAGDGYGSKGMSDARSRKINSAQIYSNRFSPETRAEINSQARAQYDSIYGEGEWSQLDREARSIHIDDMRADSPAFDDLFKDPASTEVQSVREKLYRRAGLSDPNGEGKMYGIVKYRPDGRRTMVPFDPTKPTQPQVDAAKELPDQGTLSLGDTSAEAGPVPLNRRTSPGKIENDTASGRPGTPEEGGKTPLQDPQDRVFQGRKEMDTNAAAKSFWDDVEPGGGNSIVDELDVQNLQSLDQVKDFISTRIPDVDVEDIARRLRRQPEEYVEKVFRSLADFASSRNFGALGDLRFTNTFDITGVDAGGAVVLDILTKSLGDRVSILSKEVMELTELDAPFKVQANQILDRAQSMVLIRKESTQFASQNLQNWKDVPNDLKRAVENDRQKIAQLFDELRTDLNSSDVLDIKRAKDRFAKLGIALSSTKGDPVAQMGFWEGLGRSGWNQFENVYINSLLSSPLSHARNIGGNAIAVAERSASRVLGNAMTGNFAEAKRGLAAYDAFGSTMSEAWKVARESWGSPYSRVSAGAKVTDRVAARRRELEAIVNSAQNQSQKMAGQMALRSFNLFNNPWFSWPGKGLQAGDDFFKTVLARTELRYQAAVESDSIADAASAVDRKALREKNYQILVQDKLSANGEILDHDLIKVSQEATFQRDLEGWAQGMSTGLRAMPGGRIIVPFLKTGHNINRYAKELTPLQLLSKEYGQTMKFGTPDEKAIMNGRIALGSSVMGTAAFMAGADLITGVGPLPGPQRDLWLQDHEPMSIKVGDKWVSYQAIPGFSLLMSTTADITQMTQKMRDGDVDYVLGAAPFFFTNAISTQPMFQGILDMSEMLDFKNNYTPEKAGEAIAAIANRMGGGEGLRRHMENAISTNMYEYKNWAVAFIGKVTGGIAPSAYDTIMGEDIAKVPELDVLTGKKKVSKYSNPANSVNPFTVVGKDVSPLVETFQSLDFPINLIVPEKVAGVKLTPDQKNFVQKEVYNDGKMAKEFSTTFKGGYFWGKYEEWRQQQKAGTALPKEQSDWYRILAKIQQKHKTRAVNELKKGDSEYSQQFREEYAAKNIENSKAPGVSSEDQSRLRDIQQLTNF